MYKRQTKAYKKHDRQAVAARASVVAFGVLLTFALVGEEILAYLKIWVPALHISGGLLLLLIGLELLLVLMLSLIHH